MATILVQEYVSRYEIPMLLHSNPGHDFEATVFQEMCQQLAIIKTPHSRSNGMVERFNRTLEAQLAKFADINYIPLLLLAYRSAVHDSTACIYTS